MTEKVELDFAESRLLDLRAGLFALIRTVESLERALADGLASPKEYENRCKVLLNQFATYETFLKSSKITLAYFINESGLFVPLAVEMLTRKIPTTRMQMTSMANFESTIQGSASFFQLSGELISLLDALRLGETAVDSLLPDIEKVLTSIDSIGTLPMDLRGLPELLKWRSKLLTMSAHEELTEQEARQLALDVDTAYVSVKRWLHTVDR
eukprot:Lankesteria_metandrocarpae@DN5490_c1_g4_i1.p2